MQDVEPPALVATAKATEPPSGASRELGILLLLGGVQFINIVDFMMVMPLGPDYARDLGVPVSTIGIVGGSYTAAACVSGLVGSLFLDRFDRRSALVVALLGLVVGTVAGGFATSYATLIAARVIAGAFGGPATSVSLAILADVVPPARRGRAMGIVMSAFSLASIVGVPFGLELANRSSWRMPFWVLGGAGLLVALLAWARLPSLRGHVARASASTRDAIKEGARLVADPVAQLSFLMAVFVMISMFSIIPSISPYLLRNLGYPRDRLSGLYMMGGLATLLSLRLTGKLVDRAGSARIGSVGSLGTAITVAFAFAFVAPVSTIAYFFVSYMVFSSTRMVAFNALASKVPPASERARFGSIQSAVQHGASAFGAFVSSTLLHEEAGKLVGLPTVAWLSVGCSILVIPLFWRTERALLQRVTSPQISR